MIFEQVNINQNKWSEMTFDLFVDDMKTVTENVLKLDPVSISRSRNSLVVRLKSSKSIFQSFPMRCVRRLFYVVF